MRHFRKGSISRTPHYHNQPRFEHWYRDKSIYFITARCQRGANAFSSDEAKNIFWNRFAHYTAHYAFQPWVVSLVSNHYHVLGYLPKGENLGPMMQRLHGSVAKLVNDLLPQRITPFWYDSGKQGYFDGCIRDEKQCRLTYKYVLVQSVRHRLAKDWQTYPHTRVHIEIDDAVAFALREHAFMEGVRYARYEKRNNSRVPLKRQARRGDP